MADLEGAALANIFSEPREAGVSWRPRRVAVRFNAWSENAWRCIGSKIMATWPHEETLLTEHEKAAYRDLLYWAMLDIRMLCQSRMPVDWNPLRIWWQYRRSRVAGSLADWLHNLADYSTRNFRGFDADWFWQEYDGICSRSSEFGPRSFTDYRQHYANYLTREDTK